MFQSATSEASSGVFDPRIKISIARTRSDLEQAFRLVHHSYVRAGLDGPNETGMRLCRHHFLESTEVVIAKLEDVVVSTASVIVDSPLGLPAESMYGKELQALKSRGLRIAEVGCLADRRKSPARFIQMFRRLSTLIAQAAEARGCNALIAATHPRHARFYARYLGFETFGEIHECPYANGNPAIALLLDFEAKRGTPPHDHLFGQKYRDRELAPFLWDADTQSHFLNVMRQIELGRAVAEGTQTLPPIVTGPPTPPWLETNSDQP
ncbi:long-chain N-acyl amino acid synthase [Roseiconus nitratireducens]|uniref:Long-chain N-acyl amino acid synthase n=1 Tax=Roseiconus nitratireducens TaxID=2605748 RepID=A0A5M6DFB2_9BACT|nr:long-chain N-acyl amino acid synthase [Roseiconus nitratireducens]KAA5546254.1 long-chain N-acyl amino acid synthase [Roseiconus nitratireducens]